METIKPFFIILVYCTLMVLNFYIGFAIKKPLKERIVNIIAFAFMFIMIFFINWKGLFI